MLLLSNQLPLKQQSIHRWDSLYGSSASLAIVEWVKKTQQIAFIITPDSLTTYRVEQEIQFFSKEDKNSCPTLIFSDWETLPYDRFSPHQDIISQRISTLYQLSMLKTGIVIVPMTTLMHRICPTSFIQKCSFSLKIGDSLNLDHIRTQLLHHGYQCVSQVYTHGEFCIRGSILDIFPMGSEFPFRIDLFDDEVETIRTFNKDTQLSIDKIDTINLLPAHEFPLDEQAISLFRQQWRDTFSGNPSLCPIYQDISQGIPGGGIEYYLPLFFKETACLLDYLPSSTTLFFLENIKKPAEVFWQEIEQRFKQNNVDSTRPLLEPEKVFIHYDHLLNLAKSCTQVRITSSAGENSSTNQFDVLPPPDLPVNHKLNNPLSALQQLQQDNNTARILICAESAGRRESLLELLQKNHFKVSVFSSWQQFLLAKEQLGITVAPLERGLALQKPALYLVAESQLFGQQVMQRRRRKQRAYNTDQMVRNLVELSIGSPVVHINYGVGRYLGLETIDSDNQVAEYLTLEYEGGDKLYVPIASLHLISRYSGVNIENAPLHRLGSKKWESQKQKAAKQLHDVAAELLAIYAKRESKQGFRYQLTGQHYQAFCESFPFEETLDQEKAINAVIDDMCSDKPMDRLVCGDVGFGKTEVAMRATFIAVENNKQVALLVPTTLLAQQHYETFKDRFADWPVSIEMISRFKTAKEQQKIIDKLQQGKIDIVIGTHKLLQADIHFNRLGLLIIDEEHRFGVQQKEKIKKLRAEVDLLTLTATPIPRTLNMAMSGIRDLSIIATPPAKRLSIKTFVHEQERDSHLVREAILREIMRGGQVYYLHNEVETIAVVAEKLMQLVPEARIRIGHGQMRERELESVMSDFYHQRFNVLVCTTIIENGIDIPTANTIIINRADKFGLAQLHQLRGRVGRSHHQAYAYLLTPPEKSMTPEAVKRLEAIASLEDLGAGFTLATHDLEIRGAGELLGEEQSGQIHTIGLALYTELLDKAVHALKAGQAFDVDIMQNSAIEIDIKQSALIPESYMPDVHMRLIFYKRIASCHTDEELNELQIEMIDRFGLLPPPLKTLFAVTSLKYQAEKLGINKIDMGPQGGKIEFKEKANINSLVLVKLLQAHPQRYQLKNGQNFYFKFKQLAVEFHLSELRQLLDVLQPAKEVALSS